MKATSKTIKLFLGLVLMTGIVGCEVNDPASYYLQKTYHIDKAEAMRRLELQEKIIDLSDKLNKLNDSSYADMYIQHEPVYKIVILFTDNKDHSEFIRSLDPELQKWIQVKYAKRSRDTYNKELDLINRQLNSLNLLYSLSYDLPTQKYLITIENPKDTRATTRTLSSVSLALKGFKDDVKINFGEIPKAETVTNAQKGDKLYGGNRLYKRFRDGNEIKESRCTLGYGVTYKINGVTKKGVLTSGHCHNTMYYDINGHTIKLSNPIIEYRKRNSSLELGKEPGDGKSDKYDYQIWDVTGIDIDNQIQFEDMNGIPEFPQRGILNLTSIVTFMNQKRGMIACKSGMKTGITCGTILNGNATRDGVKGWIEVGKTYQDNISKGGDSGAPWFLYPGKSSKIIGLGIHTAGRDNPDLAYYMPIDYINDHISSVRTIKKK